MTEDVEGTRKCPFCDEIIKAGAKKCRFCGEFLDGYTRESILADEYLSEGQETVVSKGLAESVRDALKSDPPAWLEDIPVQEMTPITRLKLIQFRVALNWDGATSLGGFDLSGCDLTKAQLENADLSNANLRNAVLSQANLHRAKLNNANLHEAQLIKADLREAVLYNANLAEADLLSADLSGADLKFANLGLAYMFGTDLRGTHLRRAILSRAQDLGERQLVATEDLQGAILPDGTRYDGRYNLRGDLEYARSKGIDTNNASAMTEFYDVTLEAYLEGQEWAKKNLERLKGRTDTDQ